MNQVGCGLKWDVEAEATAAGEQQLDKILNGAHCVLAAAGAA